MNAQDWKELKELVEFLKENKIGEFAVERGDLKVRIRFADESGADVAGLARLLAAQGSVQPTSSQAVLPSVHATAAPPAAESPAESADDATLHIVKSPIVGTFYESPSPGSPAFVKIGDRIEAGQVLCIVEAMKLMNEIESDATGEVVKRLVQNGQPVEYGQQLFALRVS